MAEGALRLANVVRRVAIAASSGGLWGILGYETDDDAEGVEAEPVEVFQGIGIYARPASGDRAEAVLLHVGSEADHPVLAAFRNEDARRRMVAKFGDLAPGELAIFPSSGAVRVVFKTDGTIELGGLATAALATKADIDALRGFIGAHIHTGVSSGATTSGPPATSPPTAVGTVILKAE